jgi:hypothetical protein
VTWPSAVTGFLALSLAQCGGGLPLLHPAQTLGPGEVRATTGLSASIATGDISSAIRTASDTRTAGPATPDEAYARGALAAASIAPGLAPVVGARVGLGHEMEGGLVYTSRAVRVDARRSFPLSHSWAMSLGAGGTAVIGGNEVGEPVRGLDLGTLHGWGADLPVLVGYASDADLYRLWVGVRAGWEQADLSVQGAPAVGASTAALSATRLWGGALLGLAVGFRHVHVAMEVDVCYGAVEGNYAGTHAQVAGLTWAPASSIWWEF